MAENNATLLLLDGAGTPQHDWRLGARATYTIGREKGNDILLPFSWVSRRHAMIQVEMNGRHNLIDLGSANGTMVNNRRVLTPTRLQAGDRIAIGKTVLLFQQSGLEEPAGATVYGEAADRTVAFVEQETVTILICDIHDYTRLSELMGNHMVSALLQNWTAGVSQIVTRHEGTVDKFIGDAVMALWAGGSGVDHAIRQALRTALAIAAFTHGLKKNVPELPWPLRIGAALNTGLAMVGNIGVDGKRDFTVVGDVVNVAFRLEAETDARKNLDLIMGEEAAAHLADLVPYFAPHRFTVKGKSEPVQTFGCSFRNLDAYLQHLSAPH
ncbi:MAG: adenylate/guanylate cyclase domain-containing protein [Thermodesulfobacteriota bacterium]